MDYQLITRSLFSLIVILGALFAIYKFLQKYSIGQFQIGNKLNIKSDTSFIDSENKLIEIQTKDKKYIILVSKNSSLLLDKIDLG